MSQGRKPGYFDAYIDYQVGKQFGMNPWNPHGHFTQAGIAERQREQKTKSDGQASLTRQVVPAPHASVGSYMPPLLQQTTQIAYQTYPLYDYSEVRPKSLWPGPFHAWWWLETEPLSACEELGDRMIEARWALRLLSTFLTALMFCAFGVARGLDVLFPYYALCTVALVGSVTGLFLPPITGRAILAARKVLGFAIAAILRISVAAAASAAVYIGISLINAHR